MRTSQEPPRGWRLPDRVSLRQPFPVERVEFIDCRPNIPGRNGRHAMRRQPGFAQTRRERRHDPSGRQGDSMGAPGSCRFDGLCMRVVPSQAIELTATLLDRAVATTIKRQRIAATTPQHMQDLAAVVRLCSAGAGKAYARRAFRLTPGQRCGDHDVRAYLLSLLGQQDEAPVGPAGQQDPIASAAASGSALVRASQAVLPGVSACGQRTDRLLVLALPAPGTKRHTRSPATTYQSWFSYSPHPEMYDAVQHHTFL